jgi:hypothetical protein
MQRITSFLILSIRSIDAILFDQFRCSAGLKVLFLWSIQRAGKGKRDEEEEEK